MMKKYRITYLVTHPIQYHAPLLRLISKDADFDLLTLFYWDKKQDAGYDEGFQQTVKWDIPLLSGYHSKFLFELAKSKNTFLKLIALWKALQKRDCNILWTHGYADIYTLSAIVFAKFKGIKVFVRGDSALFPDENQFPKRIVKRKIAFRLLNFFVDRYLAVGTENKIFYLQQGVPEKKIVLSHYTVDNDFFYSKYCEAKNRISELKSALKLESHRPIIFYASKFITRKYPIDIVHAFERLNKSKVTPYVLFIGTGEQLENVKAAAHAIDSDSIRFLGFKNQTELPDYFALSDIMVLPSIHENWGLIVNEAMNAECAMIVSDHIACAPDLVKPGENGFIYPARDIDALTKCLQILIDDPVLCEKMKLKSREIILQWSFAETINGLRVACESLRE